MDFSIKRSECTEVGLKNIFQHIIELIKKHDITYMCKEYIYLDMYSDDGNLEKKYQITIKEIIW